MNIRTSCRTSFPEDSSREPRLDVQLSKIRTSCSVMSQPVRWIIRQSKEILKLIETVNQKYGNTIVMVTHNDAIKDMADRVVKLRDGMIRKNYCNEHKLSASELEW